MTFATGLVPLALMAVALAVPQAASAQAAGSGRTLSIIVPQPAGNPTDGVARKLQPLLQQELQQTVIVENLPGAGGSIGTAKVLAAVPDGNTVLIASQTEPILTPASLSYVRYKPQDLRAVALVARTSYVLVGRPDLPARNLAELVTQARAPGAKPLSIGHIGPGSMMHLLGEQWSRQSGVPVLHVAYKGVPPVSQDVMAGQIDLSFLPLGGAVPSLIESGKVRPYGLTAEAVNPRFPQVAPIRAQGGELGGFVYGTWVALLVPRKTPEAAVVRLHGALARAMQGADLQAYVEGSGMDRVAPLSLPELARFYDGETRTYEALARAVGVDTK